jgi:carboxylesterase
MRSPAGWLVALAAAGVALWIAVAPLPPAPASTTPSPARDYEDALARFERARARAEADPELRRDCLPRLLAHGRRTERAVVLLHGFTNCPKQFDSLAALLHERGFNIYVPRVPRHGDTDRMSAVLAGLTAAELAACAESALDLAHGLGDRVTIAGLSSSAVAAAWLAARRPDLDEAVLIAPSLGPRKVSLFWARRLTSALLVAPNFFVWWDSKLKERVAGPTQCYPRFPSRALAQVYRLGFDVLDAAGRTKPAAGRVTIVTSACDEGVSAEAPRELMRRWRARGAEVRAYEFPESLGVRHDMIDPEQPYQGVGVSYPVLVELLAK